MTGNNKSRMRRIRLRKRLDEYALVVVLVLVVLAGAGAWLAYQTHVDPGTETEQRTTATWSEQATVSHAAEVQTPNPVFEVGQELSNQGTYFTQLSPAFEGEYTYTYTASERGELDTVIDAHLRIQSVDDDGNPYWTVTEPLETTQQTLDPGDTEGVAVELDIPAVAAEAEEIEAGLGSTIGTIQTEVVFETQVVGVVNGENVADTHQSSLTLDPDGATYSVEADDGVSETHETVETVESERTYGPVRSYGPLALLTLSLVGLVGLAGARHRGVIPPAPAEQAALEQYQQRREFDNWISTGTVPPGGRTGTEIRLDSLEDLVDVAIDTDQRVIEDTDTGGFFVLGDGRYYAYPGQSPGATIDGVRQDDTPEEGRAAIQFRPGNETPGQGHTSNGAPSQTDDGADGGRPRFDT